MRAVPNCAGKCVINLAERSTALIAQANLLAYDRDGPAWNAQFFAPLLRWPTCSVQL
jgi:hypothetical protein